MFGLRICFISEYADCNIWSTWQCVRRPIKYIHSGTNTSHGSI